MPACLLQLTALVKLSLACNQITELPAAIGDLTTLQFIDVSFNSLSALPGELANLQSLSALNVSFNPLGAATDGAMPLAILQLAALKELNLDYTGISEISRGFGNLRQLEGLQVRSEQPFCMACVLQHSRYLCEAVCRWEPSGWRGLRGGVRSVTCASLL